LRSKIRTAKKRERDAKLLRGRGVRGEGKLKREIGRGLGGEFLFEPLIEVNECRFLFSDIRHPTSDIRHPTSDIPKSHSHSNDEVGHGDAEEDHAYEEDREG